VARAEPLRDDALETHLAGVPEHDVAGLGNMKTPDTRMPRLFRAPADVVKP